MKNSLFNFFDERSRSVPRHAQPPGQPLWGRGSLGDIKTALDCIDPDDIVLCDSNIFTGRHLWLLSTLLSLPNELSIADDVEEELKIYIGMTPRTAEDAAVVQLIRNPPGKGFARIETTWNDDVVASYNYYVNLLFQRRTALSTQRKAHETTHGMPPKGNDKAKISKVVAAFSKQTAVISNKKGAGETVTDERLVTLALFLAALEDAGTARKVIVFSEDADLFVQAYKLQSLAVDDYLSHLFAEDYFERHAAFPARIPLEPSMWIKPGREIMDETTCFVVPRPRDILKLLPAARSRTELWIIRPGDQPEVFLAFPPGRIGDFLTFKGANKGKNTNRFADLNCYIQLPFASAPSYKFLKSDDRPAYFLSDRPFIDSTDSGFQISSIDLLRCLFDIESPLIIRTEGHLGHEETIANSPCHCESGLSFADCHGANTE